MVDPLRTLARFLAEGEIVQNSPWLIFQTKYAACLAHEKAFHRRPGIDSTGFAGTRHGQRFARGLDET
ncbi:hypothetical protein [Mesorhizobium sp.]|uniref:hypothetical protein n=1 Tax=Mesorhizobium sp. TaxID=1871066 RepID=UPI003BAB6187